MRTFYFPLLLIAVIFSLASCQKDLVYDDTNAVGFLKDNGTGDCLPVIINGSYTQNVILNSTNYIDIAVNISQTGNYLIKTDTVNGYSFSAAGTAAIAGISTIRLAASGKPLAAGVDVFNVNFGTSTCQVNVIAVAPGSGGGGGGGTTTAVYTLGGAPGACTGAVLAGTFTSGIVLNPATNTATVNITSTVAGSFSINSGAPVNGVTFTGSGNISSVGTGTITLTAAGTPTAPGTFNYPITAGAATCNFSVTYAAPAPPATFTINCAGAVTGGVFLATVPLNSSNTITLSANATTTGSYSVTTSASNGVTYTGSGVFTTTGTQPIVLTANGNTPAAAGAFNYTTIGGTGSCSFSVTYGAAPTGIYNCTIDGVPFSFYDRAQGDNFDEFSATPYLYLNGYTGPPNGNTVPEFQIFITKNNNAAVTTGSYNETQLAATNGYRIEIDYTVLNPDLSTTIWNTSSNLFSPNPPFTITITSITATHVNGTFSGKLTNTLQGSTMQKTVTSGVFSLPIL